MTTGINITHNQLASGCGIGYIHSYITSFGDPRNWGSRPDNFKAPVRVGGTGYHSAAYVSTPICKMVYNEMKSKYKIVFQTEKRRNENSGRQFIFTVYDRKATVTPDMNKDYPWPFGRQPKKAAA